MLSAVLKVQSAIRLDIAIGAVMLACSILTEVAGLLLLGGFAYQLALFTASVSASSVRQQQNAGGIA